MVVEGAWLVLGVVLFAWMLVHTGVVGPVGVNVSAGVSVAAIKKA